MDKDRKEDMWMKTYTGNVVYPYDLKVEQISIRDIAHSLSRTCRYAGHTPDFYSVADHCTIMSNLVSQEHALVALLHDAPEAYLRDIPRPVKSHLEGYKKLEDEVWKVVAKKFDLPYKIPKEVKDVDRGIVQAELRDIMKYDEDIFGIEQEIPDVEIEGRGMDESKYEFLERYIELTHDLE